MIRSILVAIDGSETTTRAAALAADLAAKYGATLHIVQVVPPLVVTKELEEVAQVEKLDLPTSQEVTSRHLLVPPNRSRRRRACGRSRRRCWREARRNGCSTTCRTRRSTSASWPAGARAPSGALMGSVSFKVSSLADRAVLTVK